MTEKTRSWLLVAVIATGCGAAGHSVDEDAGATSADSGMADGPSSPVDADTPGENGLDASIAQAPLTENLSLFRMTAVDAAKNMTETLCVDRNRSDRQGVIAPGSALTIRVYARPQASPDPNGVWTPHETWAVLRYASDSAHFDRIQTTALTVTEAASDNKLDSTFNFALTADEVTADLRFSASLRDPSVASSPFNWRAMYPTDETTDTMNGTFDTLFDP